MIQRCDNPNDKHYKDYGARGITVCQRWRELFVNFFADMGKRPSAKHSLDRLPDKNGNYEPSNCRWATPVEQGRNKRNNRLLTFRDQTKCVSEWAEFLGIDRKTLSQRINAYGWSTEKALGTPA